MSSVSGRREDRSRPLALTMGEPGGIGPDLALALWSRRTDDGVPPFVLIASPRFLEQRASRLGLAVPLREMDPVTLDEAVHVFAEALPVLPLSLEMPDRPGEALPDTALAVIEAIEHGVALVMSGAAAALVTNPIQKAALAAAGFAHPGHTEFLAALAERHTGRAARPVMMLADDALRVVPATIHVPLSRVPALLDADLIVETGRIMAADLASRFGIHTPRIAVAGLNPHAGEAGTMGREEVEIVAPAVARLCREGIDARGPYPADTLFHPQARRGYDAVLAMYHDQALIPIKTIAFDEAVNVTLGLPFIRTSPDHGTALDIAGTGLARAHSLAAALAMAAGMAAREAT